MKDVIMKMEKAITYLLIIDVAFELLKAVFRFQVIEYFIV